MKKKISVILIMVSTLSFGIEVLVGKPEILYTSSNECEDFETKGCIPWECKDGSDVLGTCPEWEDPGKRWPADAVVTTLRNDDGTFTSFYSYENGYQKFEGSINDPRNTYTPIINPYQYLMHNDQKLMDSPYQTNSSTNKIISGTPFFLEGWSRSTTADVGVFLKNIYKINDLELLGFLHVETFVNQTHPATYSLGLAKSNDGGESWSVLGPIVVPQNNYLISQPDAPIGYNNINGAPYLVIDGYFYVYYNETGLDYSRHVSVARAKVQDVLDLAEQGLTQAGSGFGVSGQVWQKLVNGSWINDALYYQKGDDILNLGANNLGSVHTDAAQWVLNGRVTNLLLVMENNNIILYQSDNGVNWGAKKKIAVPQESENPIGYPTIYCDKGSEDGSIIEDDFYIMYHELELPETIPADYDFDGDGVQSQDDKDIYNAVYAVQHYTTFKLRVSENKSKMKIINYGNTLGVNDETYAISTTEVTYREYEKLMGPGPWTGNESWIMGVNNYSSDYIDHPVSGINVYDALIYCNRLSDIHGLEKYYQFTDAADQNFPCDGLTSLTNRCIYNGGEIKVNSNANGFRLPHQWEWQVSYQANTNTDYFWGNFFNANYASIYKLQVGELISNDWGLFDFSGNVFELSMGISSDNMAKAYIHYFTYFDFNEILENQFDIYNMSEYSAEEKIGFRVARNWKRSIVPPILTPLLLN